MPNTFISSKYIKIVSSYKNKEILPLNRVEEMYILSVQICKIHRYETFVNMFVFSLNRLTPGQAERV